MKTRINELYIETHPLLYMCVCSEGVIRNIIVFTGEFQIFKIYFMADMHCMMWFL